jgi:hypothetical protein
MRFPNIAMQPERSRRFRPLALCLAVAVLGGCGGPMLVFPGGELSGEVVAEPVEDWSFVNDRFVDLETRPEDPYSVELNYFVREGQLYIVPAVGRTWFDHIRADPHVRVRFGDRIYPLRAVLVGKPGEIEGFDRDRYVYRLDPR